VFNASELRAVPNEPLQITFNNEDDGVQHNWALFASEEAVAEGEDPIAATELDAGPVTQTLDFGPLTDGEYYYQCDAHPGTMYGNLIVGAAEAAPAEAPAGAGEATPEATPVP
jgi:plastocyanin